MKPLEAMLPHPFRRALDRSSVKVKSSAHADHNRIDLITVSINPDFLLRATEAHPNDSSSRVIDDLHIRTVLGRCERPEWRRDRAGDHQPWKCGLQVRF